MRSRSSSCWIVRQAHKERSSLPGTDRPRAAYDLGGRVFSGIAAILSITEADPECEAAMQSCKETQRTDPHATGQSPMAY